MKPIAKWDSDETIYPGLVWWSKLDSRFQVEVQQDLAPEHKYNGTLCIFDHNDGDKLIHSQPVGVSYGAMFGPDMADVSAWCEVACQIIDSMDDGSLRHS